MAKEWVLIIELLSPGNDYMDKIPVVMPTQVACEQAKRDLPARGENPLGVQYRAICVTMDHWTGKRKDKGVAFD